MKEQRSPEEIRDSGECMHGIFSSIESFRILSGRDLAGLFPQMYCRDAECHNIDHVEVVWDHTYVVKKVRGQDKHKLSSKAHFVADISPEEYALRLSYVTGKVPVPDSVLDALEHAEGPALIARLEAAARRQQAAANLRAITVVTEEEAE